MLKSKNNFVKIIAGTAMLCLLLSLPAMAVKIGTLEKIKKEIDKGNARCKGLAITILKNIKAFDKEYRLSDGQPLYSMEDEARKELVRIQYLTESFEGTALVIDKQIDSFKKKSRKFKGSQIELDNLKNEIKKTEVNLKKYRGYIDKYYGQAIKDFGEPVEISYDPVVQQSQNDYLITGQANFGLGSAKHNYPNANPTVKSSQSEMNLGAKGTWYASEKVNVNGKFDYLQTVNRREIGISKIGGDVVYAASPEITLTGGFEKLGYSTDAEEPTTNDILLMLTGGAPMDLSALEYGESNLFATFNLNRSNLRLRSGISKLSRSYDLFDFFDYSVFRFTNSLTLPAGAGKMNIQLNYLGRSNKNNKPSDHTEINPKFIYTYNERGSKLGLDYKKISHETLEAMDYGRIKAFWSNRIDGLNKRGSLDLEVLNYNYPDADIKNYTDLKLKVQKYSTGTRRGSSSFNLMYRLYPDDSQFDFAQMELRREKKPSGSGRYNKIALTGRFYTESGSKEDTLVFYTQFRPPHSVDFVWSFGWTKKASSVLTYYSIGPKLGGRMLIDTERDKAFDNDLNDVDFVLQNPQNTLKAGIESRWHFEFSNGMLWDLRFDYSVGILYNSDPSRSTSMINFYNNLSYPVNEKLFIDGKLNLHKTSADIESASDLDRFNIGASVRYLFNLERK